MEISGNEMADRAAKEATGHKQNAQRNIEPRPESESFQIPAETTKSTIRKEMKHQWKLSWETAKHGRKLYRLGV